jgi:hypothetical protein
MGFCDFPTHRIFSENGLWQWHEKPGLARHVRRHIGNETVLAVGFAKLVLHTTNHTIGTNGKAIK